MATHTRARLAAERRSGTGKKSQLKSLRHGGQIPASLYGHGEPENIQISAQLLHQHLRQHALSALVDLEVDGHAVPVLIREVERNGLTGQIQHLGFQRVDLRENVRATIPLVFHGEETLISEGWVFERQFSEVEVHGQADRIPEVMIVEVGGGHPGQGIHISDLKFPAGVVPSRAPETLIARISTPTVPADVQAQLDAELEAHAQERVAHATAQASEGEAAEEEEEPALASR